MEGSEIRPESVRNGAGLSSIANRKDPELRKWITDVV